MGRKFRFELFWKYKKLKHRNLALYVCGGGYICLITLIADHFLHLCACFTCSSAHLSNFHPLLAHHHLCYVDVYCVTFAFCVYLFAVLVWFHIVVFFHFWFCGFSLPCWHYNLSFFICSMFKLKWRNIFCIVSLPLFIMKQIIFPLHLHHHISANDIHADRHPFFTLYLNSVENSGKSVCHNDFSQDNHHVKIKTHKISILRYDLSKRRLVTSIFTYLTWRARGLGLHSAIQYIYHVKSLLHSFNKGILSWGI